MKGKMQMGKLYSFATLNIKCFPFLSFLTHTTTPRESLETYMKDTWPGHLKAPIPDEYTEGNILQHRNIQSLKIWIKLGKP